MAHVPLTIINIDEIAIPHVDTLNTYDGNNNVDDQFCSAVEHVRAVAEQDQAARDLAEARRRFPTPASGRVEDDEEGVRPIEGGDDSMEDGSGSEEDGSGEEDEDRTTNEASFHQSATSLTTTVVGSTNPPTPPSPPPPSTTPTVKTKTTTATNPTMQPGSSASSATTPPTIATALPCLYLPKSVDVAEEAEDEARRPPPVAVIYGPTAEQGYEARGLPPYTGKEATHRPSLRAERMRRGALSVPYRLPQADSSSTTG